MTGEVSRLEEESSQRGQGLDILVRGLRRWLDARREMARVEQEVGELVRELS